MRAARVKRNRDKTGTGIGYYTGVGYIRMGRC